MKDFYDYWREYGNGGRETNHTLRVVLILFLIMFLYGCLCLFGILISKAEAEPLYGADVLGLAKQDTKMIAQEMWPNSVMGVLAGTFGPVIKPLEDTINDSNGKVIGYRAHLGNGTCLRNGVCGPGEFPPTDFKTMRKRARDFHDLNSRHPGLKCWLSPYLEQDEKRKEVVNKWVKIIREEAPECTVVISAFTGFRPKGPGILQEYHGNTNKGDITSNDGQDIFQTDAQKYLKNATVISFLWTPRDNLRLDSEKTFIPPLKRKEKLEREHMVHKRRLLEPVAPVPSAPATCKKVIQIKSPEIGKVRSEDYGSQATDNRSGTPLLITKMKTDKFSVRNSLGEEVACAKYFGPFNQFYRYYVGSCSGEDATRLMNKLKNEWGFWESKGTCYLYNSIRRNGALHG